MSTPYILIAVNISNCTVHTRKPDSKLKGQYTVQWKKHAYSAKARTLLAPVIWYNMLHSCT